MPGDAKTTEYVMVASVEKPEATDEIESRICRLADKAVESGRDPQAAAKLMLGWLAEEKTDRQALTERLVWRGILDAIYAARHHDKIAVKREPVVASRIAANPSRVTLATLAAAAPVAQRTILDTWRMPNGLPLGNWTGAELVVESERERRTGSGHLKVALFYQSLARKAGDRRVRDVVGVAEAIRLWAKAEGSGFTEYTEHSNGKRKAAVA